MNIRVSLLILLAAIPFARILADTREGPVGLVLSGSDAKLVRAGSETALSAKAADLLFTGDTLRTGSAQASILFCPGKTRQTLDPGTEVRFKADQVVVKSGKIAAQQPSGSCLLPAVVRVSVASQQYYGASMTRGGGDPVAPIAHDKLPAAVLAELAPFETALANSAADALPLIGMAAVFEKANLISNALAIYTKIRAGWPDTIWVKEKIFELEQKLEEQAKAAEAARPAGSTFALLIGISKYKNPELALQFADKDAESFEQVLSSPRAGGIPKENMLLLVNEKATTAAVRNAFHTFFQQRAGKNDTIIITIAGHGTVETPGSRKGFVLTYDADPQDLQSTALPMDELKALFQEQLSRVRRVMMYVDVCRAGVIGTISNLTINNDVQSLGESPGDLFLFMASRPRQKSIEGPNFGGGHGAFTYFVLKGLMGDADMDGNGKVDLDELIQFVSESVPANTQKNQHPANFLNFDGSTTVADLSRPGIPIARYDILRNPRTGEPLYFAFAGGQLPAQDTGLARELTAFGQALQDRRLRPGERDDAFSLLEKMKGQLTPERFASLQNQLRIALEQRAQEVLLRYLAGDQVPQKQADFEAASRDTETARLLTPESIFLQGRGSFFEGRALLFQKRYADAVPLLEEAVRVDPGAGYAYNALGIAYLEQARFDKAIPAFHDAARRAQHWAYPLHNLALAYSEVGDYKAAIRSYETAIRLAPSYGYLHYNLGTIYQRMNRGKDAAAEYHKALDLSPDLADAYNGLGSRQAAERKFGQAEASYREALKIDSRLLAARQNLALLLFDDTDRKAEALQLWRENLSLEPTYLASRLSLADALTKRGEDASAIGEYREALRQKPAYVAARIALADLLLKTKALDAALDELNQALKLSPGNALVLERIGDVQTARRQPEEARKAYREALSSATNGEMKKRLRSKEAK